MALQNREIGERITALRATRGSPPQEVVAQRIGVAYRSYQAWEAGDTKPSWRNLTKLARYYKTSEEFILMGDALESEPEVSQLDRIEVALGSLSHHLEKVERRLNEIATREEVSDEKLMDALGPQLLEVFREALASQDKASPDQAEPDHPEESLGANGG